MKRRGQVVYSHADRLARLSVSNIETGCIEWIGSTRNGYGRLVIGSRSDGTRESVSAHRLSYETHVGCIPVGLEVCHKCDNRRCINPSHLFLGTRQDNVNDREQKGRNVIQRGEKCGTSKLSDVDVISARRLRTCGHTYKSIAERFAVDKSTIMRAIKGKQWTHVKDEDHER